MLPFCTLCALCVSVANPTIIALMAHVIDGAAIAQQVKSDVARRVAELKQLGHRVHLTAILVGASPAGELYARRQGEACAAVGIEYDLLTLPAESAMRDVKSQIRRLNDDPGVNGIMMHLPLPQQLDTQR